MKDVIGAVMDKVTAQFPKVPVLSNIGNNDLLNHYQAPSSIEKAMFYGDLYKMWFENVEANYEAVKSDVPETFRQGGYYRWDLSSEVTLLSINSIFMNFKNQENNSDDEQIQLEWLEE